MNPISRREFLRAGGLLALGAGLTACGRSTPSKPSGNSLRAIIAGRPQGLSVVAVQGEILSGESVRYPFALFDVRTNQRYTGGSARVWVARDETSPAAGPFEAAWHDKMLGDRGVYLSRLPLDADGAWLALVEATPAESGGKKLLGGTQVGVGRRTKQPAAGDKAIVVASPTTSDHRGVNPICTRRPICSMHDISLDAALKNGKPTVLVIGTPAFCESKTCGPVVTILDGVKQRTPRGTMNFVHVELYVDDTDAPAKGALAPAAAAWKIEEEPAIYFIKPDGTIVERFVGAADFDEIAQQAQQLRSA